MLSATEQQLELIERRSEKLEHTVQTQVEQLKAITAERDVVDRETAELRQRLEGLQRKSDELHRSHAEASLRLRTTAAEFEKAQLLGKKYRNTVGELKGFCKSYVVVGEGSGVDVADPCTVDVDDTLSMTFDGVVHRSALEDQGAQVLGLRNAVRECCEGYNTTLLSFGPSRTGKTTAMFGADGIARQHVQHLFAAMPDLEVTHFNLRVSFGEVFDDDFLDHLVDYGQSLAIPPAGGDVRSIPAQTAEEAIRLLDFGMQRASTARRSAGHLFFALSVESFNRRGHYRKGSALFVDIAGVPVVAPGHTRTLDQQWITQSVSKFCMALTALATRAQRGDDVDDARHHASRGPGLLRLLSEALGGNSKTAMVVVVGSPASKDEVVSALTYATHFKSIQNQPSPYDIPAELQKLNMEATCTNPMSR